MHSIPFLLSMYQRLWQSETRDGCTALSGPQRLTPALSPSSWLRFACVAMVASTCSGSRRRKDWKLVAIFMGLMRVSFPFGEWLAKSNDVLFQSCFKSLLSLSSHVVSGRPGSWNIFSMAILVSLSFQSHRLHTFNRPSSQRNKLLSFSRIDNI